MSGLSYFSENDIEQHKEQILQRKLKLCEQRCAPKEASSVKSAVLETEKKTLQRLDSEIESETMFAHNIINDSERLQSHSSSMYGLLPERKTMDAIKARLTMRMSSGQALMSHKVPRFSESYGKDNQTLCEVKPLATSLLTGSTEPQTADLPSQKNGPPDQL